jgi:hypothetical protein
MERPSRRHDGGRSRIAFGTKKRKFIRKVISININNNTIIYIYLLEYFIINNNKNTDIT